MLFIGCADKKKQAAASPVIETTFEGNGREYMETKPIEYNIRTVHDTLVIIQTTDTLLYPDTTIDEGFYALSGGWSQGPINLFKNGKTKDTVHEHKIVYK